MKIDFKQKAVSALLGLAFLLTQAINAQNLTISNAGETGTSGTNWSIVGNELLVSSLNSNASVHPSVIENHLLNNGDLIITLPWIDGINRNIVISNSISYGGANQRSLTFKSANAIIISSSTSISATSASLNLVFRAGMNTASTNPESGKIQFNSATISTNGGHVWIGGGQTDTTWNALQVGNTKAKTFSENESGVLISNCTIATNGGNLSINGISHVVQTISGTANQGVLIENSNINSGAGSILIDGQVNGKYKNGYGVLITSSSNNTSLNSTSGLISIQGLGQDETGTDNGYRHALFLNVTNGYDISIATISGALVLDGNAAFSVAATQDKSGLQLQVNHVDSFIKVVSQTGNISLKGTNPDDADGQFNNAIRFGAAAVANSIRIGFDGVNSYNGNILVEGNSIYQRLNQSGAGSIAVKTTGSITIQSKDNSFTYLRAGTSDLLKLDDDWDFGTTCSNFTFGKTTNTAIINTIHPISVAGPISIYSGLLRIENTITSSNTGDINLIANGSNSGMLPSIYIYADILKTGGQRSKLTVRGGGRVQYVENKKIEATNAVLDVIFWSDYDNTNNDGGTTVYGDITSNGGHVWLGGSNSNGGSSIWNGLMVGDGPSIGTSGQTNYNAMDLGANISTTGGDVFIWTGDANTAGGGYRGIQVFFGNKTINAGGGNITLIVNEGIKSNILTLRTTGKISIAPNAASFVSNPFVFQGSMSGNHFVGSNNMNFIQIDNFQSVNELNLGHYSNLNGWNFANTGAITINSEIVINGAVRINSSTLALNANLKTQNSSNLYIKGNTTISAGKYIQCSGDFSHDGNLIFKSSADGTAAFGTLGGTFTTINGTTTVERYIPAKRAFRFVSSPVTTTTTIKQNWQENAGTTAGLGTHITGAGGATNGFDATETNNPSMYTFTGGAWAAVTNTNVNVLTAGTPYRLMVRGDRTTDLTTNTPTPTVTTLRDTGTLKTGSFSPTINQTADGYSLIGNPYQAPIDIKAILTAASNMNAGVVYYWDPTLNTRGGYVTRDLTTDLNDVTSGFNQYVQPGQAVFVKRDNTANAASVTITESHKSVANGAAGVFRTTTPNDFGLLRVNLQANTNNQWQNIEGTLALFNDNFSWNVTPEDATKMSNLDEEVSFVQNNTSLAIACLSAPNANAELPIKLNNIRQSNYQWQFELANYQGERPYLYDAQNNTYTEITNGVVVPFTATTAAANRFKIVFQPSALSTDDFANGLVVYPNPAKAGASFFVQGITAAQVTVYNVLRQNIPVQVKSQGNVLQVTPTQTLSQGIYLVTVTTEGKTQQVKWIVE